MSESEDGLMVRVAWLYYVGGFNQEATASRLGLTRARVNKILGEARETVLSVFQSIIRMLAHCP